MNKNVKILLNPKTDIITFATSLNTEELENLIDTNLNGTINTLYFAKRNQAAIIFLSTSRVYPYDTLANANLTFSPKRFNLSNVQTLKGLTEKGIDELAELIHPHPSIIEGIQECIRMLLGKSIYTDVVEIDSSKFLLGFADTAMQFKYDVFLTKGSL